MQKVDGVEAVRVSLNDGLTILDLKAGNTITLAAVRQIVKNNGFVSKEARVVARGAPSPQNDRRFVIGGTGEVLELSAPPQRSGDDWKLTVAAPGKK
jgi:hypothetical protein